MYILLYTLSSVLNEPILIYSLTDVDITFIQTEIAVINSNLFHMLQLCNKTCVRIANQQTDNISNSLYLGDAATMDTGVVLSIKELKKFTASLCLPYIQKVTTVNCLMSSLGLPVSYT